MKTIFLALITFFSVNTYANHSSETVIFSKPDHTSWNTLSKKYINQNGDVNYKAFKKDEAKLDAYLQYLASNAPSKDWSKNEKLAYYINLYNAGTVKLILKNYPVKSIKDISKPWDKEWLKVGNKTFSLGQIEHEVLRKMNEPRIHFAINCASYSCPKLSNEAYTATNTQAKLKQATIDFVNDKKRNIITPNKVQLSAIFKWFKDDFTKNGSVIDFIKPYAKTKIESKVKISYLTYDWSLNESK
ncbi:DUF547 domain-containing protein [Cellulophaga baltica]|uniref:DUF547 domain-containing protein n=1 Tax=Cellulophaga TaxID=104264 RepID=UPI001C06CB48|nr:MULTISPECIES: DUF547 domain-containing protein [Cellulophaga]MBU2995480.1 DUF547 domain-containing protein [Cellulophaga baltica]MDO6766874.1 DUF547 domain-containing protein [Cellulophaga sp. 1_MG-2023]